MDVKVHKRNRPFCVLDEIERRMAGDTLNEDYAVILRSRAIAAQARGHIAEALDYQTRYADLSKVVSDSLHRGEAHDYAARYHAQEQQLEIQQKEAQTKRMHIVILAIAVIALLAIAFALYFFRQKRIVSEKNHALIRMINDTLPAPSSKAPATSTPSSETAELFTNIDQAIRSEQLYRNVNLQRQDICDRFNISRHTLNDILAEHTGGLSFPQYINAIRMEVAYDLLTNHPEMNITNVARKVGFTAPNFRLQFKRCYGVTPAEYRATLINDEDSDYET